MHRVIIIFLIIFLLGGGYSYYNTHKESVENKIIQTVQQVEQNTNTPSATSEISKSNGTEVQIVGENLDTPWAIAFLPDRSMLITERPGRVRLVTADGKLQTAPVATVNSVKEIGEGGLLGITLHPDFSSNRYVYLYYTYSGNGNNTMNRVVRMSYNDGKLSDEKIIIDAIPGASNHNGGRIAFGPDKLLYIGTGDAQEPSQAQDARSLAGKILRVKDDGSPADINPGKQSENRSYDERIYSYGHRNVQGLAWDSDGQLWATEHGPSGTQSCCDELNKIEMGENYGWPEIQDTKTREGMITPIRSSGKETWAPAGLAYASGDLFFAGLRGQRLYHAEFQSGQLFRVHEHFEGKYGRLREMILGPDNMLYVTTSNKDGRGTPKNGDDKILRINPEKL